MRHLKFVIVMVLMLQGPKKDFGPLWTINIPLFFGPLEAL